MGRRCHTLCFHCGQIPVGERGEVLQKHAEQEYEPTALNDLIVSENENKDGPKGDCPWQADAAA